MNRRDRRASARDSRKAVSSSGLFTPAALCDLARREMQAGRPLEAQLACQQALALDPDRTEALHLMGLLSLQARQYDHAIEWIARAGRQDLKTDYLGSLGIALEQQGLLQEAFKAFDRAVQLRPDDVELWTNHGNALLKLERPADALLSYHQVLMLDPLHADAAYGCCCLLLKLGRLEEALRSFNRCDELRPNQAAVLEQRGVVLLVSCLDLVISVDTGVVHLAGALARPTWVLLPFTPDYRWLLGRDDSPWYPTVRLYRQSAARDWSEVLDRLRADLVERVSAFGQRSDESS